MSSFATMFRGGQSLQFLLTEVHASVEGDFAWVTVDENLLGDQGGATVAAVNVFARAGATWRIVVHHGSAVHTSRV